MNDEYIVKTVLHAGSEIINFIPGTKVCISVVLSLIIQDFYL